MANLLLGVQAEAFDPNTFLEEGWLIDEQDERSLVLNQVYLSEIALETCLKEDERSISGEENLERLKQAGHIRLDARFFIALWNKKLIPDAWKGYVIYFDGTILRRSNGSGFRYILYLIWVDHDQCWCWNPARLDFDRRANGLSAVLKNAKRE